jgi:hypothetical protein
MTAYTMVIVISESTVKYKKVVGSFQKIVPGGISWPLD